MPADRSHAVISITAFTTVIDLASPPDVVEQWNKQDVRPHAYFCGPAPVLDGYPMNFIPKPFRYDVAPYFLFDEARSDEFPDKYVPAEHMPQAVVAKMHDDGAICVKTFFEPGFGPQDDLPVPTKEIVRDLVTAANEKGMPVLLHANSLSAQAFGVETDVDGFAHGMWNWDEGRAVRLNPEVTLVLDAIIERNIVTQPTMQVLYGERELHNPDYLSGSELQDVLPKSLIDWYETDDGRWFRNLMLDNPRVGASSGKRTLGGIGQCADRPRLRGALLSCFEWRAVKLRHRHPEQSNLRKSSRP